jgi:putative transcriptional regulator
MANHPNRSGRSKARNPKPEEIIRARGSMTQTEAASLVHYSLRAWQQFEAGDRRMHPAIWELFRIKSAK